MRRSAFKDRPETRKGTAAEEAMSWWLRRRGGHVLPAYDYSGLDEDKAPRLAAFVPEDSLVLPDLMHARAGRSLWIEVKFKESADWTRVTQRYETGLSLRLWRHYEKVEAVTGIPVWLMFVHRQEAEVRGESLQTLDGVKRIYDGGKMGRHGMAFFPWDELRRIARTDELALEQRLARATAA